MAGKKFGSLMQSQALLQGILGNLAVSLAMFVCLN